jgi:hypothetical protein
MARKPQGPQALTGAERQARYRARHEGTAGGPACVMTRHRPPTAARTAPRVRRWQAAVGELVALQAEYAAWLAALPEATRDGATGEALQAIIDLDLDEIMTIQPPRGFGRD